MICLTCCLTNYSAERMNEPVIRVEQLVKIFSLAQVPVGFLNRLRALVYPVYTQVAAVDAISFQVHAGEKVAFIGPNGSGKSTTIKMLTGILSPTSGVVRVLGKVPLVDRSSLAYSIGTVFGQRSQLWFHLPPIDTFYLFSRIYALDDAVYKKRLSFLVEAFEIEDMLHVPVRKLSLGERMRCEIVGSLLHAPRILFLDEPTIGLDVISKQQVRDVINYLNEQEHMTVFLTSHDAGDIEAIASRSLVINQGRIIFDDTTRELKSKYLTTKVVELIMLEDIRDFDCGQGNIVSRQKHAVKIEIDASITAIEKLLHYAFENFTVLDINMSSPALEEVIASIYRESRR